MTETDDKILTQLGTARHALAVARSIGDFKKIADVAALAKRYAKRVKLSQETADFALKIRLRAERGLARCWLERRNIRVAKAQTHSARR